MTRIVGYGTGWFIAREALTVPLTEVAARKRLQTGKDVAAELATLIYTRAYVIHAQKNECIILGLLGWPIDVRNSASVFFQRTPSGNLALRQIGINSNVPDDAMGGDGAFWTQMIYLFQGSVRATLDVPSIQSRFIVDLASSQVHAEVAALEFKHPDLGDYDHLLRPDLFERCILDLEAFDPALPGVREVHGDRIYDLEVASRRVAKGRIPSSGA